MENVLSNGKKFKVKKCKAKHMVNAERVVGSTDKKFAFGCALISQLAEIENDEGEFKRVVFEEVLEMDTKDITTLSNAIGGNFIQSAPEI